MSVSVEADLSGLRALATRLQAIDGLTVRAGVLRPDGEQPATFDEQTGEIGLTMAELATVQEYGRRDGTIPARPAMLRAASEREQIAGDFVGAIGEYIGAAALRALGGHAAAALRPAAIRTVRRIEQAYETTRQWAKPNAPSTVRKKGFDFPLTETGALKRSMSYEITDRRGAVRAKGKHE